MGEKMIDISNEIEVLNEAAKLERCGTRRHSTFDVFFGAKGNFVAYEVGNFIAEQYLDIEPWRYVGRYRKRSKDPSILDLLAADIVAWALERAEA